MHDLCIEFYHSHSLSSLMMYCSIGLQDHTDDVVCLAVSPDGTTCATGQLGKTPFIVVRPSLHEEVCLYFVSANNRDLDPCVFVLVCSYLQLWDANTGKKKTVISGFHKRAVSLLDFSKSGKLLRTCITVIYEFS